MTGVQTCALPICGEAGGRDIVGAEGGQRGEQAQEQIDFNKARELLQKERKGEKLTADEATYLQQAKEAFAKRQGTLGGNKRPEGGPTGGKESIGFKPLTEMKASDSYKGQDGGLYGGGQNSPPETHRKAAEAELARIQPLDAKGKPVFTGSFNEYRWSHPAAGIDYLARTHLASVARAVRRDLEDEQVPLYIALLAELRDKVRQRYDAPLVLICDWPETVAEGDDDRVYMPYFKDIQALGLPMVSVRRILGPFDNWKNYAIQIGRAHV